MNDLCADSKCNLVKALAKRDIGVLPRGKGRTKDQIECWIMYRCLSTLANYNALEYPLKLTKRERPDWLLVRAGKGIGCEITEAVNKEKLRAQSLPESQSYGSLVDPSLFKHGQEERSLQELREIVAREKLTGSGWAGNAVEREYAEIVRSASESKTISLNKDGFDRFNGNWLLIYCNYMLPILKLEEASEICRDRLESYWGPSTFDTISVEFSDRIVCYSRHATETMVLNDVWGKKLTKKGIGRILRRCFGRP